MKDSLNDFLNLDLVNYAYSRGYTEIKSGKQSTTWISLKNPSSGDHIRIKTKPLPMVFNNNDANLSQDRGNIVNFVINRLEGPVIENPRPSRELFNNAFTVLKETTGDIEVKVNFTKSENLDIKDYVKSKLKNIQDCTDFSRKYLAEVRNIDPSILDIPLFSGKIKESLVPMKNGKVIGNICFLKTDLNGTGTGIVVHYPKVVTEKDERGNDVKKKINEKRVYELKDNIWISNVINNPKILIYGESAIDCLSHYEIKKTPGACYASLEGADSEEKNKKLLELYNHLGNNTTLCSITDNDYNGINYDLKIAIHLYNQKNYKNPIERVQEPNSIKYIVHGELKGIDINALKEKMLLFLKAEAPNNHQLFTPYLNLVQLKDKTIINVPFKDNNQKVSGFLKPLIEAIHQANDVKFYNRKSISKDWNEDLQETKKKLIKNNLGQKI